MAQSPQKKAADDRAQARRREIGLKAYSLWLEKRMPLRQIAETLSETFGHLSHETVRKALYEYMDHIVEEFDDEIRSLRAKQLRRLLSQYERFEKIAMSEADVYKSTKAGTLCLGILKEINEVLGVKAAVKIEHSGSMDLTVDIDSKINEIYGELEESTIDA